jgi:sialic acid synthase SpsE
MEIKIGNHYVGENQPVYFVAEIGSNHDGDLKRAIELIRLAAESGANAAKFQNFSAPSLISDFGFKKITNINSHQSKWKKSVFEVYQEASTPFEWANKLCEMCTEHGLDYFSAPYDLEAVNMLERYFPAVKIGSGDITWLEIIELIASKNKPVLMSTGASTIADVQRAVETVLRINKALILMQCNTNYTRSAENFKHINLNVLKTYATLYPDVVLGLSDHTSGHSTALGAIALGAKVIEKHFTDDKGRKGPDHAYAMDPKDFREMVDRSRELESALGSTQKFIADNEKETAIVQRRCLCAARDISKGELLVRELIDVLRPCLPGSIPPYEIENVIGLSAAVDVAYGEAITYRMLK